ncbi:putative monocarboxylate transporter mch1 [Ophidiomyces ophidiicola]|nr:putative monocarboxylate transporter mch1 [Ophidiomyces ophidiicola]KAI1994424.1 putative monocarboxylate transporter mch1 [Ophidiomyces ophidiicola]KAI1994970.1 putative monocarboxylate transporter mch1 [Ophidiomyces ophidiicola]
MGGPSQPDRGGVSIDKRDFDANRTPPTGLRGWHSAESDGLLCDVVSEIVERDRQLMRRELVRMGSFIWGVLTAACAGSITGFSIYGPLFLSRLNYSQFRVNAVSVTAELAMYLPVPFFGYLCDRYSPAPVALISAFLFGPGYLLAALTYRSGPPVDSGGSGWPYWVMILAFVGVGAGTASMYLSAVTTCAKNFGRSKHKGFMLAMPIAAFGLSGMWQSQVGRHLLYERGFNGEKGDVDVFRYFLFLSILLFSVGVGGVFALRVVDEDKLIDAAVEELERSGLLDESSFFRPREEIEAAYGTFNTGATRGDVAETGSITSSQEERQKKAWLLNHETRLFLQDRTMWWLAAGFFLASGPGEAYINNVGTVINTLTPPSYPPNKPAPAGHPSTHVAIIALTSTMARLLTGSLSDIFAPSSPSHLRSPLDISDSLSPVPKRRFTLSRLSFLLPSAFLLSFGYIYLATPLPLQHPSTFPLTTSLIGFGYGATFSLVPIIISVVWDVENFGTNWGIVAMVPALGATVWGMVYSFGYEAAITPGMGRECRGWSCYGYWALGCAASVWLAIILWGIAWRGWRKRGVVV